MSKNQPQMKRNAIQIELELSETQKCTLVLTPQNYKQEFRAFVQKHHIDHEHVFYIKNVVQSKMISIYNGYQEMSKLKESNALEREVNSHWKEGKQSPKFGNVDSKQTQTQLKEDVQAKYFKSKEKSLNESLFSTHIPSAANYNPILKQGQITYKMSVHNEYNIKQEVSMDIFQNMHLHQQSLPIIATVKKLQKDKQQNAKNTSTKKKAHLAHSPSLKVNRLYEASTESFRNKKNKDIDHKQFEDYLEVEKHLMNNHLKRTTQDFFNHLHSTNTASFEAKSPSNKKLSPQVESVNTPSPSKKVSPSKSYKGSHWQSGCRCEMKIRQQQQLKNQKSQKEKEQSIKKRITLQKLLNQSQVKQQPAHRSRCCQKCNPSPPKKSKIQRRQMPEPIKRAPRPYISNLLVDSYNQFKNQISHF